jgi:hypothetical protein
VSLRPGSRRADDTRAHAWRLYGVPPRSSVLCFLPCFVAAVFKIICQRTLRLWAGKVKGSGS